jgi:hypothetical protein
MILYEWAKCELHRVFGIRLPYSHGSACVAMEIRMKSKEK